MSSAHWPRPSRARMWLGLSLALLMQGSWLVFLQLKSPGKLPAPTLIELRLLAPQRPDAKPGPQPRGRSTARISKALPLAPTPEHISLPANPVTAITTVEAPPVVAGPKPLNLALPTERAASGPQNAAALSLRKQVRIDPRSNSARRTLETAIADGAGTLPVTMQASTDGTQSTVIRQGSKCIRVSEARIKTLHPMDDTARGTSSVTGTCFKD